MLKFAVLPALCLALCAAPTFAQAIDAAAPAAESLPAPSAPAIDAPAAPEQILVVGQKPGPGMWKVSKDGHVLWIFGDYSPLPIQMQWRSHEVEAAIAASQEYLAPPAASAQVGYLKGALLLPSLIGVKKIPDGASLREVLPPEVYARWQPMKEKYLPGNDERERPVFIAGELFGAALKQAGLTNKTGVRMRVEKIVDERKLKVTKSTIHLPMDNVRQMVKDFKKAPVEDVDCLNSTILRLETDIDAMRVRANAWGKGDIDAIRKLDFVDQEESCRDAVFNSAAVRKDPAFQSIGPRLKALWLSAAESALARNASTFALLPLKEIFDPEGVVAALVEKGYKVEQPE